MREGGGGLGHAIIGTVPSWEWYMMPTSGWPMYGIELLIIGSQCNSLLRFWYHIVYRCCTSVVPCAAMCLLAQLFILLAKLCAASVPSEN